jgi:hypothetical protein
LTKTYKKNKSTGLRCALSTAEICFFHFDIKVFTQTRFMAIRLNLHSKDINPISSWSSEGLSDTVFVGMFKLPTVLQIGRKLLISQKKFQIHLPL